VDSRLAVLFRDEPPLDEVRDRLSRIGTVAPVEGDPWALAVEVPVEGRSLALRVAPVEPPTLDATILGAARFEDEGERIAAEAAQAAVAIEGRLGGPALPAFRAQLAAAAAVAGERSSGVVDLSALRLVTPGELESLVGTSAAPRARDLLMIHSIGSRHRGRLWLHTHGLARAGVPDLEALRVRDEDRDDAAKAIFTLADLLVSGDVAPSGVVPIGEGVAVALLDLEDALARVDEDETGGERSRDEAHRGTRMVVAPPRARRDGSVIEPDEVCEAIRGAPVLFSSHAETERQARVARERLPRLRGLYVEHAREPGWVFLVKLAFEVARGREHLWFRVVGLEPARVEGVLENEPRDVATMKKGARGWHDLARLSDWVAIAPDGSRIGPDATEP
jgi:hypothetical protein